MDDLKLKIRTIPDFPIPGIKFRDITTLLADPDAFNDVKIFFFSKRLNIRLGSLSERLKVLIPEKLILFS